MEMKHVDIDWAKGVAQLLQHNYPERLYRAYIVPSNVIFRGIWSICKVNIRLSSELTSILTPCG
jgi:hypothetical protein